MSDPPLSDIDFENKMALVWTTLNYNGFRNEDYITEQIKDISGKLEHVSAR